ncbi:SHOCT domain-containing protein [Virgibacillus oceani]|nr:SHOCT domain-containing protein [Virgibacillus oceani]
MDGNSLFLWMFIIFWLGLLILGILLVINYVNGGNEKKSQQILNTRLKNGAIDESENSRLKSISERNKKA